MLNISHAVTGSVIVLTLDIVCTDNVRAEDCFVTRLLYTLAQKKGRAITQSKHDIIYMRYTYSYSINHT